MAQMRLNQAFNERLTLNESQSKKIQKRKKKTTAYKTTESNSQQKHKE